MLRLGLNSATIFSYPIFSSSCWTWASEFSNNDSGAWEPWMNYFQCFCQSWCLLRKTIQKNNRIVAVLLCLHLMLLAPLFCAGIYCSYHGVARNLFAIFQLRKIEYKQVSFRVMKMSSSTGWPREGAEGADCLSLENNYYCIFSQVFLLQGGLTRAHIYFCPQGLSLLSAALYAVVYKFLVSTYWNNKNFILGNMIWQV